MCLINVILNPNQLIQIKLDWSNHQLCQEVCSSEKNENEYFRNIFESFCRFLFTIVVSRRPSVRPSQLGHSTFWKWNERILISIRSRGQLRKTGLLERTLSSLRRVGVDQSTLRGRKRFLHRQGRVWAFHLQGKQNQKKI